MRLAHSPPHNRRGGMLNSRFYCPLRIIHVVRMSERGRKQKFSIFSFELRVSRSRKTKEKKWKERKNESDNIWWPIIVVIKCLCIRAFRNCLRRERQGVLARWTLKPRSEEGNPEDISSHRHRARWVMGRKQEAHINCRIYFGYGRNTLRPQIHPSRRPKARENFKMIFRNIPVWSVRSFRGEL